MVVTCWPFRVSRDHPHLTPVHTERDNIPIISERKSI